VGQYWVPRYLFKSLVLRPLWPIVQTPMRDEDDFWSNWWNENWQGNRSTRRKPTPAPFCPPQNRTWQTRSRTPDCSGGKPATNHLSYGMAFLIPFRRLLQLAGSRWRYLTSPPHGCWGRLNGGSILLRRTSLVIDFYCSWALNYCGK
jgi:hypothetical protein